MSKVATVHFYQQYAEIISDGARKLVSHETAVNLLQHLTIQTTNEGADLSVKGTILPRNTLLLNSSAREAHLLTYHPGRRGFMRHSNGNSYDIPYPNIIVQFRLARTGEQYRVATVDYYMTNLPMQVIATKGFITRPNPKEGIWHMALPNFFGNGAPCFGGNSMPHSISLTNLRELDWYYDYLEGSTSNNDLSINHLASGHPRNPATYLENLQALPATAEYPYEWLIN